MNASNAPNSRIDRKARLCHRERMKSSLTATEFSRIVQKDRKTVIRWIQQRLIPGVKRVGRSYQIPISEVEVFQNSDEYPVKSCQK